MKVLLLSLFILLVQTSNGNHVKTKCQELMTFFRPILNGESEISCNLHKLTIVKNSGERINILHKYEMAVSPFHPPLIRRGMNIEGDPSVRSLNSLHMAADGIPFQNFGIQRSGINCKMAKEMWNGIDSEIICNSFKQHPFDGTCVVPHHKGLTAAQRPFKRLLKPDFCDGYGQSRCSKSGQPLPNSREVSSGIQLKPKELSFTFSAFFMQWGQYISHDISHTPTSKANCDCDNVDSTECANIKLNKCEKFTQNRMCLSLDRSMKTPPLKCTDDSWLEQINQVTPLIDASTVYGSSNTLAEELFENPRSPLLKVLEDYKQGPLLPTKIKLSHKHGLRIACPKINNPDSSKCFAGGDFRVNETPMLSSVHLVWVRQHNRLVYELANVNRHWSGERIREEARKIVIAQHQIVTYGEYLPLVLGPRAMSSWDLILPPRINRYPRRVFDSTIDSRTSNVFATAAFRFGHSQIPNEMKRRKTKGRSRNSFLANLRHDFFNATTVYDDEIGPYGLLWGTLESSSQKVGPSFADALRNHMFSPNDAVPGLDLLAINIERGREHGIPSYMKWREYCRLPLYTSFEDACKLFGDYTDVLRNLYESIWDIDLYVGALIEQPVKGGVVGPTFACLLGEQFHRLRKGDRFWFENGGKDWQFNDEQLHQLRLTTLSQLICDNIPEFREIQRRAFYLPTHKENFPVECEDLKRPDLSLWAEGYGNNILRNEDEDEGWFNIMPSLPNWLKKYFSWDFTLPEISLPSLPSFGITDLTPDLGLSNIASWFFRSGNSGMLPQKLVAISLYQDHNYSKYINKVQRLRSGDMVYVEVEAPKHEDALMHVKECSLYSGMNRSHDLQLDTEERLRNNLITEGCPGSDKTVLLLPSQPCCKFRFKFRLRAFPKLLPNSINISISPTKFIRQPKIVCSVLVCPSHEGHLCQSSCK